MARLSRFVANAGAVGCLLSCAVALVLFFALLRDARTGHWLITVPTLFAVFGVSFLLRDRLVESVATTRVVMNSIAAIGCLCVVFLPTPEPEPLWLRVSVGALVGGYMGCYFWMLSDERISTA